MTLKVEPCFVHSAFFLKALAYSELREWMKERKKETGFGLSLLFTQSQKQARQEEEF